MPLYILYVVPEDPEKPHISQEVPYGAVEKERSNESDIRAERHLRIYVNSVSDLEGNDTVARNDIVPVPSHPQLDEMNEAVHGYE